MTEILEDSWPDPPPASSGTNELIRWLNSLNPPDDQDWSDAKCVGEAPHLWDLDWYESREEAELAGPRLCHGCPLIIECAKGALKPLSATMRQSDVIRAGVVVGGSSSTLRLRAIAGGKVPDVSVGVLTRGERRQIIRELSEKGVSRRQIARMVGASESMVWKVASG